MADPNFFTLVEFRALPDCGGSTFTDTQINTAASYFTQIVTNELGALLQQSYTETLDGLWLRSVILSRGDFVSLTSVTVDGATVNTNLLTVSPAGVLRYLDGCTRFSGIRVANVVVTYTAGLYATVPADVKDAVMWATRDRLQTQSDQSGVDIRKTSMTTDYGVTSYVLPGENRPTGYPDLDAVIASHKRASGPAVG